MIVVYSIHLKVNNSSNNADLLIAHIFDVSSCLNGSNVHGICIPYSLSVAIIV